MCSLFPKNNINVIKKRKMINSSHYTLITEQKNDILINLKVIGKIGPGDKINTKKKHFDKDNTCWYQPFLRLYRGDSRECSINQVKYLIDETNTLIALAIRNKHNYIEEFFYKNFSSEEFLNMLWDEKIIHNALTGVENLKDTYNNDSNITSRLECLITVLRKNIEKLEKEIKTIKQTSTENQEIEKKSSPLIVPISSSVGSIPSLTPSPLPSPVPSPSPMSTNTLKEIDDMIR